MKRKAVEENCFVDVGFWGGAIPGNVEIDPDTLRKLGETYRSSLPDVHRRAESAADL